MLDDLYWVMSYSRWKDERYWPQFRDALMREHPSQIDAGLRKAQEYNFQRYHFQGIGRYAPDAAYARGLADLRVLRMRCRPDGYLHGPKPTGIDAGIYGFVANIWFFAIDTPLKQFVASQQNIVRHCEGDPCRGDAGVRRARAVGPRDAFGRRTRGERRVEAQWSCLLAPHSRHGCLEHEVCNSVQVRRICDSEFNAKISRRVVRWKNQAGPGLPRPVQASKPQLIGLLK